MKPRWHRLIMEEGRPVLSGRTVDDEDPPPRGVWVKTLDTRDGGYTTLEVVSKDGVIVHQTLCHSGQERAAVYEVAAQYMAKRP